MQNSPCAPSFFTTPCGRKVPPHSRTSRPAHLGQIATQGREKFFYRGSGLAKESEIRTHTMEENLKLKHFDQKRAEKAVRELLLAVGEDPDREGLKQTPARVARAFQETFAGLHTDPRDVLSTTFDENHQELVLVRDIPIYSTCEHHLVPFFGKAHIGYIPGKDGKVTGLSKLARLVDGYAKRPQVQERLTTQVADALVECLDAQSVIVVIECEHLCMAMRGIRKPGAMTTTSAVRGGFKRNAASRAEVLSLIRQ